MMNISDRWILISDSRASAAKCLEDYIETFSIKWRQERSDLITALEQKDKSTIHQRLRDTLATRASGELSPQKTLLSALDQTDEWTPIAVLAAAWLLLK